MDIFPSFSSIQCWNQFILWRRYLQNLLENETVTQIFWWGGHVTHTAPLIRSLRTLWKKATESWRQRRRYLATFYFLSGTVLVPNKVKSEGRWLWFTESPYNIPHFHFYCLLGSQYPISKPTHLYSQRGSQWIVDAFRRTPVTTLWLHTHSSHGWLLWAQPRYSSELTYIGKAGKLRAKSGPWFVFVDKVLLQHSHTHLLSMSAFTFAFQQHSCVVTELRRCDRYLATHKSKIFTSWPCVCSR